MRMLDIFPSSGSSGVNEPCSYGLPSTQHFTQGTDMLGAPLLPAEAPMLGEGGVGSQFGMSLQEHGMSYSSQATLPSPQMIYNQGVLPPQPGMMMPQMMPLEPRIPEVNMPSSGSLGLPPSGLPVSVSKGIPEMSHNRAPMMPSSDPLEGPSNCASLAPKMLQTPTIPSTEALSALPSLAQVLPPREPHNLRIPAAGSPLWLPLESQGSFVSQPAPQEDFFLLEQPTPAAQGVDNSWAQEREPSRRSPVSRPYICQYENCGKAYTKRSHLVSHERKHTGDRLYKCQWEGCNWSFFRSDELTRHSRIHTRYRPHRCEQCGRQFMRSDHLRQHQRIHQRMPGSPDPQAEGEQMDDTLLPGL
ncbi:Krueppel-like factor 17 isoform X2 [Oryctolagus cuniculus]